MEPLDPASSTTAGNRGNVLSTTVLHPGVALPHFFPDHMIALPGSSRLLFTLNLHPEHSEIYAALVGHRLRLPTTSRGLKSILVKSANNLRFSALQL